MEGAGLMLFGLGVFFAAAVWPDKVSLRRFSTATYLNTMPMENGRCLPPGSLWALSIPPL
jgi:hypothetical protein